MNQITTLLLLYALTSSIVAVVAVAPIVNEIAYASLSSQLQGSDNAASQIQGKGNANNVQGSDNGGDNGHH